MKDKYEPRSATISSNGKTWVAHPIPESKRWMRRFTAPFRAMRAFLTGYYWLPCKLCGEYHAGFEYSGYIPTSRHGGSSCCPMYNCMKTARKMEVDMYENSSLDPH